MNDTQIDIAFGKYISGYRPGDEGWSELDQEVYEEVMDSTYRFITEDCAGLSPLQPWNLPCTDVSHNPPTHMHVPQGMSYKHKCPSCGRIQEIFGSATYC